MQSSPTATKTAVADLSRRLRAGRVYRREELAADSNAVDRHLKQLQDMGRLRKLSPGLYYVPRESAYGALPPDDQELITAFLREADFLMVPPASYNTLGLGSTQLYNRTVVYNHKRHGQFTLGNRTLDFRMKPRFPTKLYPEFLLVDLLNNLDELAEERETLLRAASLVHKLDAGKLTHAACKYGKVATRKMIEQWLHG